MPDCWRQAVAAFYAAVVAGDAKLEDLGLAPAGQVDAADRSRLGWAPGSTAAEISGSRSGGEGHCTGVSSTTTNHNNTSNGGVEAARVKQGPMAGQRKEARPNYKVSGCNACEHSR